jgi:CDP-glucose 4,6-dehydratase
MFDGFYAKKRALVTGHTGFKGGWLALWLSKLGAKVWGVSLPPPTEPNLREVFKADVFAGEITCDVRDLNSLQAAVKQIQPDIIFHLAAQPIVRLSYQEPVETFQTNVVGTMNLLESVRRAELPCPVIVVTSDKCYENREWDFAYRETDPLGGHDVYSMSKAATELVAHAWHKSFFIPDPKLGPVATVRAGNVIGGGDYAKDRIVPDCMRALIASKPILVRSPRSVRPWQHVLECLSGYLWLGARIGKAGKASLLAGAFNFGPNVASRQPVANLVKEVLKSWPGEWVDASVAGSPHEAELLSLSIDKASALLDWFPCWDFAEAIRRTVLWYQQRHSAQRPDMAEFSSLQIDHYVKSAAAQGIAWSCDPCSGSGSDISSTRPQFDKSRK